MTISTKAMSDIGVESRRIQKPDGSDLSNLLTYPIAGRPAGIPKARDFPGFHVSPADKKEELVGHTLSPSFSMPFNRLSPAVSSPLFFCSIWRIRGRS